MLVAMRDGFDVSVESGILTPEECESAYAAAPAVPLSKERINEIVKFATQSDSKCDTCHGHGRINHGDDDPECPDCHGTGRSKGGAS